MNKSLNAALEYAEIGFAVLPIYPIKNGQCSCSKGDKCGSPGKHPPTRNGSSGASKDTDQIRAWFTKWPDANVAIATGKVSGVTVVDDDPRHGGDKSLLELQQKCGPLPETPVQDTGGGGNHYFFRYIPGLKNKTNALPGIDIKNDGGYVLVDPSNHISGGRYEWKILYHPSDIDFAELPDSWLEVLSARDKAAQQVQPPHTDNFIPEGERDSTLFREGCRMWEYGANEEVIRAALTTMNDTQCTPSLPDSQVEKIIRSIVDRYNPGSLRVRPEGFALNDFGLGERFVHYYGESARYCKTWGTWLLWDGKRWRPDDTGEVEELGRQVIKRIPEEVASIQDDDSRSKILKFAAKCCHRNYLENMLRMAQTMPGIPVTREQLDKNIWFLNCQNGTLDLRIGKLSEHSQLDMLTKIIPINYIPDAKAPTFIKFLNRIFNGNKSIIGFLQRAAGYSLTGSTMEQVLFLCYGNGANGKSTLINTLCDVTGDYGTSTPMTTFVDRQAGAATNDIARMRGLRLITALETNKGGSLDEGTVKQLTGGDPVTARFLHKEFFEFLPTFKFWLGFNHRPIIKGTDYGIWRRIKLIPFEETISDQEKDKGLPDKLKAELPGVLAWMVQGCIEWQHIGLQCPQEVEAATDDYRNDMDIFGDFLIACCVVGSTDRVQSDVLYRRYQQYCRDSGLRPLSAKRVGSLMKERGFKTVEGRSRRFFWDGISVTPEDPGGDFID